MAEETTTHKHTHKEQRRQYTFNKLKAFGQEIIEDIEKEKYLNEGFDGYIAKPFTRDQIKEKLDKIIK